MIDDTGMWNACKAVGTKRWFALVDPMYDPMVPQADE
jgi:hypothetical protein